MSALRTAGLLLVSLLVAVAAANMAGADGHEAGEATDAKATAKPWDQEAVGALAEKFADASGEAYTAIYTQGSTSGSLGSGSSRDYHRLRDKARVIDREAKHYRAAIRRGEGHDETLPIFERLMVEVRDARVLARRVMIQQMTADKITAASDVLRQIGEHYDPAEFERGPAPPLAEQK